MTTQACDGSISPVVLVSFLLFSKWQYSIESCRFKIFGETVMNMENFPKYGSTVEDFTLEMD